jgi:hypothetical protein
VRSRIFQVFCMVTLSLLFVGCQSNKAKIQSFRYFENAKQKPIAALVPLISRVAAPDVAWDVCQEITAEVHRRIINKGEIFLNPIQLSSRLSTKLHSEDLVAITRNDLNEFRPENEYVVFMELIEHQELRSDVLEAQATDPSLQNERDILSVRVRLRVYDLRLEEPKVILQEILHAQYFIPKVERHLDYHKVVWGGDSYSASVYGRTHAKLEKDLAHQIVNYICISK